MPTMYRPRPPSFNPDPKLNLNLRDDKKKTGSPQKVPRHKKFSEEWNAYATFLKEKESNFVDNDPNNRAQSQSRTARSPSRASHVPHPPQKEPGHRSSRGSVDLGRKSHMPRPTNTIDPSTDIPDFSMIENEKIRQKLEESFANATQATDMNSRVERRFVYWKSFWENIQNLRQEGDVPDNFSMDNFGGNFPNDAPRKEQILTPTRKRVPSTKSRPKHLESLSNSNSANTQRATSPFKSPLPKQHTDNTNNNIRRNTVKSPVTARSPTPNQNKPTRRQPTTDRTPVKTPFKTPVKNAPPHPGSQKKPPKLNPDDTNPVQYRIKTPPKADRQANSNLARFWEEEIKRKGVPRLPEKKKKRPTFVAPERPEDAKKMWQDMKNDLEKKFAHLAEEKGGKKPNTSRSPSNKSNNYGNEGNHSQYSHVNVARENIFGKPEQPPPPIPAKEDPLWRLSVKDLKQRLGWAGVNVLGAAEKGDLVALLRQAENNQKKKRVEDERRREDEIVLRKARIERQKEEEVQEKTRDKIVKEVAQWAKGKNIKKMLNDVMGYKSPDKNFLKRYDSMTPISKAYKKALLKIHPDKHMGDYAGHIRATELFKMVNGAFTTYKTKNPRRALGGRRPR